MPSMREIYDCFSTEYDELVNHEDYQNNLGRFLNEQIQSDQTVLELGVGTGRITRHYIQKARGAVCCDRSNHMLARAAANLSRWADKITFLQLDHRELNQLDVKADSVVEGWALGHSAIDDFANLRIFLETLMGKIKRILNPGGKIIFIETMGTNCDEPNSPDHRLSAMYELFEQVYGMHQTVIRTDYCFRDVNEARRIMSFFFGKDLNQTVKHPIVKEFTGIWVKSCRSCGLRVSDRAVSWPKGI